MKKTLAKGLALAFIGSLFVAGSAMAVPSDYFTTTDFTTGGDGTLGINLLSSNAAAAGYDFGIFWVDDILSPNVTTAMDITFKDQYTGLPTSYGQLDWTADGTLWDVFDHNGSVTTQDVSNIFGFYFLDGLNYYYTDTSLSGSGVVVTELTDTVFLFQYGAAQVTMSVSVDDISPAPVPEPATMLLFGTGLAGLATLRRRKTNK